MCKYIVLINLDPDILSDPKFEVYSDINGDMMEFDYIEEAIEQAKNKGVEKFVVCKKSTNLIKNE